MTKPFPTPPEAMREEWAALPWYAVEAPNMGEAAVADRLEAAGLPALAPLTGVEVRACRHDKRTVLRAHPALPGYIFAAIAREEDWPVLLETKGVYRVVAMQQRPVAFGARQIVRFLQRLGDLQPDPPVDPSVEYFAGQELRLRGFEWRDRTVEFVARRGPQAEVLGWMMGSQRTLHVPVDRLFAA